VLALRRAGYKADGFECNPALVRASAAIFALSFFTRVGSARYDTFVCRMAGVSRGLLRGRKEPVELGDQLSCSYNHLFTREAIEGELREAGIRLVHYGEVGDGHAVGAIE